MNALSWTSAIAVTLGCADTLFLRRRSRAAPTSPPVTLSSTEK
jgi:hypothetical protein